MFDEDMGRDDRCFYASSEENDGNVMSLECTAIIVR